MISPEDESAAVSEGWDSTHPFSLISKQRNAFQRGIQYVKLAFDSEVSNLRMLCCLIAGSVGGLAVWFTIDHNDMGGACILTAMTLGEVCFLLYS